MTKIEIVEEMIRLQNLKDKTRYHRLKCVIDEQLNRYESLLDAIEQSEKEARKKFNEDTVKALHVSRN
jgi:hypothetical protein